MKQNVKIKGIYKHYKGDLYIVEDIALHSETLEKYVVYRALYGDNQLWIRPYDMFVEEIESDFGIVELARTGITSLERGEGSFTDDI